MKCFKPGCILFVVFALKSLSAQVNIPMGQWRFHTSYRFISKIEATDKYVYAASEKGLFKVFIGTGEMTRLNKTDGITGLNATAMMYSKPTKTLIIGYSDGKILLLKNDKDIYQVNGFYNTPIQGDKSIRHICLYNNEAYLSTDFGILMVDLNLAIIKESYTSISSSGGYQEVLSCAIKGDSLFAGTPTGLISAPLNTGQNLYNYLNWNRQNFGKPFKAMAALGDSIIFHTDTLLFCYNKGKITPFYDNNTYPVADIKLINNKVEIFRQKGIIQVSRPGNIRTTNVNFIAQGTLGPDDNYWYCTGLGGGLILKLKTGDEIYFEPNGPSADLSYRMSKQGDQLLVSSGGVSGNYGNAYNPTGYYIFNNGGWVSNLATPLTFQWYDYTQVFNNKVTGKSYIASHVKGMLELQGLTPVKVWNQQNSTLGNVTGLSDMRVSGLDADEQGNLWVTNYGADTALHKMSPEGSWTEYFVGRSDLKQVLVDQNGYKWIIVNNAPAGILVYDEIKKKSRLLNKSDNKINTDLVTNLALDKNGAIWVGTSAGVCIFNNPSRVFDYSSPFEAVQNTVEEDGIPEYIGGTEYINDLLIDGGNRKWLATDNGLFVISSDGRSTLFQYREDNSPLPSNQVKTVGYLENQGEVFVGTENGIASLKTDATASTNSFGKIKIYPNPVKPGFNGVITIEGLAYNSEVKITDGSGQLVYQTTSNGGTATWNGLRLDGTKPSSGVYLVFAMNSDGSETALGKFILAR